MMAGPARLGDGLLRLEWFEVSDGAALCNDFTRAGYFLGRQNASDSWIIFLESATLARPATGVSL